MKSYLLSLFGVFLTVINVYSQSNISAETDSLTLDSTHNYSIVKSTEIFKTDSNSTKMDSLNEDTLVDKIGVISINSDVDTTTLDSTQSYSMTKSIEVFDIDSNTVKDDSLHRDTLIEITIVESTDSLIVLEPDSIENEKTDLDTILLDSISIQEAQLFNDDTKEISDSLEAKNHDIEIVKIESVLDTTKPYGIKVIKEFEMSGGVYHYLLMDAQHPEKLLHKPKFRHKNDVYKYEDLIVKLEHKGSKMNLYSIILTESIIGSLERFDKIYFVSDGVKILRVEEKGGHNNFFKDFAKLYLDSDESILKGKNFKNVASLVKFYNDFDPEKVEEQEATKYQKID